MKTSVVPKSKKMSRLAKIVILSIAIFPFAATNMFGTVFEVTLNLSSGSKTMTDQSSNPLYAGTGADGTGDVLQVGWYTNATTGNPFGNGTFNIMAGQGSANTANVPNSSPSEGYNQISIGDINFNAGSPGTFALQMNFITGDSTSGNALPAVGTPLSIRFFNATTVGAATQTNAVSDASWVWPTAATPPSQPTLTLSLDNVNLVWLGGPSSAFETIPEPSTYALVATGMVLIPIARRRLRARKALRNVPE